MATSPDYLYRILRFDYAVEALNGTLHFSHPSTWEDPYETRVKHEYDHALFAQCWSKEWSSDAMWRIYSPDKLGVRLRTTRTALLAAMEEYAENNQEFSPRLRDVTYLPPSSYKKRIEDLEAIMAAEIFCNSSTAADILCIKRNAFIHENEVRAIFHHKKAERPVAGKSVKIEPIKIKVGNLKLINGVMFDPRTPDVLCDAMKLYLVKELKFKGKIEKSKLYTVPQ